MEEYSRGTPSENCSCAYKTFKLLSNVVCNFRLPIELFWCSSDFLLNDNTGITNGVYSKWLNIKCFRFSIIAIILMGKRELVALLNLSSWYRGYKTFFILNSTEHEISTAYKN